jgi:hypothetical protein
MIKDSLSKLNYEIDYYLFAFASKANKEYLIATYPRLSLEIEELSRKGYKYINWLYDRFSPDHKKTETHPISDCIPTLKKYQEKEASLSDKYCVH